METTPDRPDPAALDPAALDPAALGRALRDRRAAAGRTIASVAMDAGLSVPYIANLENGRGNPTVAALSRLAQALGTRLHVGFVDEEPGTTRASPHSDAVLRFARNARFLHECERIAALIGRPALTVRQRLLATLTAMADVVPNPLTEWDCHRIVDVAVLIAYSEPPA